MGGACRATSGRLTCSSGRRVCGAENARGKKGGRGRGVVAAAMRTSGGTDGAGGGGVWSSGKRRTHVHSILRAAVRTQRAGVKAEATHMSSNGASTAPEQSSSGSDENDDVENVVIIGSGPAGYTAAIYAARANLRPLVFEGYQAGGVRGGQLMTTTEVENFPGFDEGISGPDLMDRMRRQAERWGSVLHTEDVMRLNLSERPFTIESSERTVRANSIILAMGAAAKRLNLPSEHQFWSRGISACAICDGSSPIFKNQEVAVVGGGDTAVEEAIYLTKYASHVHLLVRRDILRASKAMQDRVFNHSGVTVHLNTEPIDVVGDARGSMSGIRLKSNGEERLLDCRGLFYGIGHKPNTEIVEGQVDLDHAKYVKVSGGVRTSVDGVFAAGDLHDHEWRQAVTAAGSGCMSAIAAERFLTERDILREYHQVEAPVVVGAEAVASAATAAAATSASASSSSEKKMSEDGAEVEFDINEKKHKGQYALRKLYHSSPRVLAVFYSATTCGPCRTLKPIFNKVTDEYGDKMHIVEIQIDVDPEIAEAAGVTGTPTVQFFKNKAKIGEVAGVKMKRDYRVVIDEFIDKDGDNDGDGGATADKNETQASKSEKRATAMAATKRTQR